MSGFENDTGDSSFAAFFYFVNFQADEFSVRVNSSTRHENLLLTWRAFVTISSLLAAFIITGNALVMAAFATNPRLRAGTHKLLVSLAVSDFLVGSVSMPLWIYVRKMNYSPERTALTLLPALFKYFDIFSAMASIFHLVVICVERHIAISHPFKHISASFYRLMIAAAWMFAILFSLVWEVQFLREFYAIVVFVGGFLLPMTVITFVYGNILRTARALIHRTPDLHRSNLIRDERRVAITVFLVTVLFVLCWSPFFIVSIIAQFRIDAVLADGKLHFQLLVILVKWLHYSNSVVNPVLYAFRDREMRATFSWMFLKLLRQICNRSKKPQEQNDGIELHPPNPAIETPFY